MDGVISDTELACRQTILNYISNNILTDPADTFRKTTRPEPMSVDPFKKTFTIPNAVIKLPDSTNKYYVYTIFGEDYILSAGVPKNKWFTTEHIAEKYHVLLRIPFLNWMRRCASCGGCEIKATSISHCV